MLGSQSWYIALACPTVLVGGFIASRKRLTYQWREELMDPDGNAYPPVTDAEMEHFRRVAPAAAVEAKEGKNPRNRITDARAVSTGVDDAYGVAVPREQNIGLRVRNDVLTGQEQTVYLNEVRRWAAEFGNAVDARKVSAFEQRIVKEMELAHERQHERKATTQSSPSFLSYVKASVYTTFGWPSPSKSRELALLSSLQSNFFGETCMISDHAEDIQLMRAPWGCGDGMQTAKMPPALRHLVEQARRAHDGVGRLRHVYVEYSPQGTFFREPRTPKGYDGHDYVIIPIRRDGGDTVVTFAPALRSKFSVLTEVMSNSWTSRDVDAFLPAGSMLRTSGAARYDWGWGVRPGPVWFGSRLNPINRAIAADEKKYFSPPSSSSSSSVVANAAPTNKSSAASSATGGGDLPLRDAALVVLHFEGPRAENKQRSLLFQPESLIFGKPPTVETYEKWVDDRPTREDVQDEGVLRFMAKRYFEMLTVS